MYTPGSARIPDTPGRDASAAEARAVSPRELTIAFRGKEPFTFEGATRYEDGKTFLRRFKGEISLHSHAAFRDVLTREWTANQPVPGHWNAVIYVALDQLTGGAAQRKIKTYADARDGVAAFKSLERLVEQHASRTRKPQLNHLIANWVIPDINRDPSHSLAKLVDVMREKEGLTDYPDSDKIDDLRMLVPADYVLLLETHPLDGDIESLVERIESYYKEQESKKRGRRPTSRNQRADRVPDNRPSAALIQDHSGGRGGRGGRNGRGGRGRGGGREGAGGRGARPLGPCYLCRGPHLARDCPHRQTAQQAVSAAMTRVPTEDAQQAAATASTTQQPQQGNASQLQAGSSSSAQANAVAGHITVSRSNGDNVVDFNHGVVCGSVTTTPG